MLQKDKFYRRLGNVAATISCFLLLVDCVQIIKFVLLQKATFATKVRVWHLASFMSTSIGFELLINTLMIIGLLRFLLGEREDQRYLEIESIVALIFSVILNITLIPIILLGSSRIVR